jgi:hypothetical protein
LFWIIFLLTYHQYASIPGYGFGLWFIFFYYLLISDIMAYRNW